ncbi:cytochrome P450 [Kutzneria sp. 744]|uniref:cytochrome P450 n=1 Tax=Kutzneria sp. (strain 744) TaxID=345341 RepID=UPI0018DCF142|nr:cytochrome P450 [Kutzneria sp. 744]
MTITGSGSVPSLINGKALPYSFWGPDALGLGDQAHEAVPAVQVPLRDGYTITSVLREHDVRAILADRDCQRFSQNYALVGKALGDKFEAAGKPRETMGLVHPLAMLFNIGDEHMRLRTPFRQWFTRTRLPEAEIRQVTDQLIAAWPGPGEPFDLVDALAFPLAMTIICNLLGVPASDRDMVRPWTHDMMAADQETSVGGSLKLAAYLADLLKAKAAKPGEDILSALLTASAHGPRLTDAEILTNAVLLVIAGHETTVGLISNMVVALLQHRLWRSVVADTSLIPAAVQETLWCHAPLKNAAYRVAVCDVDLGEGVVIPEGDVVLPNLLTANRGWRRRRPNPDVFDLYRPKEASLAFGHGAHACLGAQLAQLEARIAAAAMVAKAPDLQLHSVGEFRESQITHRPDQVLVSY